MDASFSFYPFPREQPKKLSKGRRERAGNHVFSGAEQIPPLMFFGEIIEIHPREPFVQGACVHGRMGLEEHSHFARCAQ